ncbi:hypothetical protein DOY81_003408 [Sarcophaga bullata]|nr:hypothetical protein DOY81_003408 [Sarcophaga bullata]
MKKNNGLSSLHMSGIAKVNARLIGTLVGAILQRNNILAGT